MGPEWIYRVLTLCYLAGFESFGVTAAKVENRGCLSHHTVYGTSGKWVHSKEHDLVEVYELDVGGMNYPNNM